VVIGENAASKQSKYFKIFASFALDSNMNQNILQDNPVTSRGTTFLSPWEGLAFNHVEVRGIVVGCHAIGNSGYQMSIDDGTSRIAGVIWNHDNGSNEPGISDVYNRFVSIRGQLAVFRRETQVKVDELMLFPTEEEPTEEALWWFEVKEEWESLAANAVRLQHEEGEIKVRCPCICHCGPSGTPCRCLGKPSSWSPYFNKAVAVIASALRTMAPCSISIENLVLFVKEASSASAYLRAAPCLADCASVEAVRYLIREGYASRSDRGPFVNIFLEVDSNTSRDDVGNHSIYPLSQVIEPDGSDLPVLGPPRKGNPKFSSASQPIV
jgi:hypothetical protein